VTHTLWALSTLGFEVWFKAATSLLQGFGLIDRFPEDLDLKIEPGTVTALPCVSNWKSEGAKATAERKAYFEAMQRALVVPGCRAELANETVDKAWRSETLCVIYPGLYPSELSPEVSRHVLLKVGTARVTPYLSSDITSWVNDKLTTSGLGQALGANRARNVRCVYPLVTLLEKPDALHRRFPNPNALPQTFVRHFEDAARLVQVVDQLPPLDGYAHVRALADDMLSRHQLMTMPTADDPGLSPQDDTRWAAIRNAYRASQPMFWGPRVSIDDACAAIRAWLACDLG
jgi:hypothetical protein